MKKLWLSSLLFLIPSIAAAHVGYVIDQGTFNAHIGKDFSYLFSPLQYWNNVLYILATIAVVILLYIASFRISLLRRFFDHIHSRLMQYKLFIPWILRLSLGIALIGAALHGAFVSSLASGNGWILTLELYTGFAFLLGALLLPATIAAIIIFCAALSQNHYIMGNLELLGAALSLLILGSGKPGVDDLLSIRMLKLDNLKPLIPLFLRIGVGGSLTFLALYEKVLNPHVSAAVVNQYGLTAIIGVSPAMWVFGVGAIELLVGLCIYFGFKTRLVSAIAFLMLIVTFFFFKEEVYSHVLFFGVLSATFILGSGKYSVDEWIRFRKK